MAEWANVIVLLENKIPSHEEGALVWRLKANGVFSVKSTYHELLENRRLLGKDFCEAIWIKLFLKGSSPLVSSSGWH